MRNKKQQFKSICLAGACPEILKTETSIGLRNSSQPDKIIYFSKKEWEELREAFVEKRV